VSSVVDMAGFHAEVAARLAAATAPKPFLLALVSWLDRRLADATPQSLEAQLLGRAVIAAGRPLAAKHATVARTLEAARAYVGDPTDDRYEAFQIAATASYPYGPGDGCFAIAELGYAGCDVGSGCRSGAGSLVCVAEEIGYECVAEAVRREVSEWLRGDLAPAAEAPPR
jgi:hypothetical protein